MTPKPEKVAEGVWRLGGDLKQSMNVYFIESEGGVTQFDAGTKPMTKHVKRTGDEVGGIKRVVLGHAHADHRGTAPKLDAPILCHSDEVGDAQGDGGLHYFDLDRVEWWPAKAIYPTLLKRLWDGGPVKIADTIAEGDEVAGFKVVHLRPVVPHRVFAHDYAASIDSVRKLAALEPATVWTGHTHHPLKVEPAEVRATLERAADKAAAAA